MKPAMDQTSLPSPRLASSPYRDHEGDISGRVVGSAYLPLRSRE